MMVNRTLWPNGSEDSQETTKTQMVKARITIDFEANIDEVNLACHMVPELLGAALINTTAWSCPSLNVIEIKGKLV